MIKWSRIQLGFSVLTAAGLWQTLRERVSFASRSGKNSAAALTGKSPLVDVVGAVHVHSTYSDGIGSVPEIVEAAVAAGVDFVLLTDHSSLEAITNGEAKWYADGKALIVVGTEITTDLGHILALGIPASMPVDPGSIDEVQNNIAENNGFGIVALPCDLKDHWRDFDKFPVGYGIEVFNLSSIARTKINIPGLLIATGRFFSRNKAKAFNLIASRPVAELKRWDQLCVDAHKSGNPIPNTIGSLDAHGVMKIARRKFNIPTYSDVFKVLTTHVLLDHPLNRCECGSQEDIESIFHALRIGSSYVCYDLFGDPKGFSFTIKNGSNSASIGSKISLLKGIQAEIDLPIKNAIIRLILNGKVVAKTRGRTLSMKIRKPGVYRVEISTYASRYGALCFGVHPWIFSNPIQVIKP